MPMFCHNYLKEKCCKKKVFTCLARAGLATSCFKMDALKRWDGFFGEGFCAQGIPIADLRKIIVYYAYVPFVIDTDDIVRSFGRSKYSLVEMFDRSEFTLHYRFHGHTGLEFFTLGLIEVGKPRYTTPKLRIWSDGHYHIFGPDLLSSGQIGIPQEGEFAMRLIGPFLQWGIPGNPPIWPGTKRLYIRDLNQMFVCAEAAYCSIVAKN